MTQPAETRPCFDDPRIADDEILFRHIHPTQLKHEASSPVHFRPVSGAFIDKELSEDRASLTTIEAILAKRPMTHIAGVAAGDVRKLGYNVWWDPTADNAAHAIICPKLTKKHASSIVRHPAVMRFINPSSLIRE